MKGFRRFLQVRPVRRCEHFHFNLLNFYFFKNSEWKDQLLATFYHCPQLTAIPYVLTMEFILFKRKRYFIELRDKVVGIFAIGEKSDDLYISSLAVAPEFRRLGIATYAINYVYKLADHISKKRIVLSVSKTNMPALRLYKKLGFIEKKERKWSLVLAKKVRIN